MQEKEQQIEISFELSDELAQGTYTNLAVVMHSQSEFVLDFARMVPGGAKAKIYSRVILSPDNAKRLMLQLEENVARYEQALGTISLVPNGVKQDDRTAFMPFGKPKGEA